MKIESILTKPRLITEGWNDPKMTLLEQRVIQPWVRDIERYIVEAQLTADQVKQIFAATEKAAVAGGGSRTLVGKGVDAAKFIDQKINDLGTALKNAGPVKNMDAKFNELKEKIGAKDSKVVNGIKAVSDWAKANPGKASLAVAVLTIAASMAAGPLGGAIAGFLSRVTKDLLQGADLSTAIGKSIKTAAYGAIAGWALQGIGDWLEGLRFDQIPYDKMPDLTKFEIGFDSTLEIPGFSSIRELGTISIPTDQVEEFTGLLNTMVEATAASGTTSDPAALDAFNQLWNFAKSFDPVEYMADKTFIDSVLQNIAAENDTFLQTMKVANDAITAVAQGSIAASDDEKIDFKVGGKEVTPEEENPNVVKSNTESYYVQRRPLSEGQVYMLFNKIDRQQDIVMEGPMDLLKKGAGAVGKGLAWAGKQATEKITSAKLFASWKLEGSPTDSEELAKFLQGQGVGDDIVKQVYTDMKLPAPGEKPQDPLGTHGYDDQLGMAFTSPEDRAEFAKLAGYDLGVPTKVTINPKAQPWDAERFKREALPKMIQDAIKELSVAEKKSLLAKLQPAKA